MFTIILRSYTPYSVQLVLQFTHSYTNIFQHTQTCLRILTQTHTLEALCLKATDSSVHISAFISLLTYVFTRSLGSKWVPTEHVIWGFPAICLLQKFCLCVRFWHEWNSAHTCVYIANKSQNLVLTAGWIRTLARALASGQGGHSVWEQLPDSSPKAHLCSLPHPKAQNHSKVKVPATVCKKCCSGYHRTDTEATVLSTTFSKPCTSTCSLILPKAMSSLTLQVLKERTNHYCPQR